MSSLNAGGWTCLEQAGVSIVNISNCSSNPHKRILLLCDGKPTCMGGDSSEACLQNITAANWQKTPIDCLYISADPAGILFMQQLAALNNGSFVLVGGE